jgi:hypothetical protein
MEVFPLVAIEGSPGNSTAEGICANWYGPS